MESSDDRVEIEPDDGGASGKQGAHCRLADAGSSPGDPCDLAREGSRLAPSLQLRLLEIPVLDVEDVLRGQRLVALDRLGPEDDVDRVLVELLDDPRFLRGAAEARKPESGLEHDARCRVEDDLALL